MRYCNQYVNHILRFYSRFPKPETFKNPIDEENWYIADKVLNSLPRENKNVIMEVYKRPDTLSDNVYQVSKEYNINQDIVWTMLNKVTRKIAKEKELI